MTLKDLLKNEIVINFSKLFSANVIAQVIGLIVYPILSRLYTPDDFGLLSLFMSIGGILVLFSSGEYQYAIVLPTQDKEKDAVSIFHVATFICFLVTRTITLTIPFADKIAQLFNTPQLSSFYCFLPIYVLFNRMWQILSYWFVRQKQYSAISTYQLSNNTLNSIFKIGFGFLKKNS